MDLIIIRLAFIVVVAIACYHLKPFGLANLPGWEASWASAGAGVVADKVSPKKACILQAATGVTAQLF